MVAANLSVAQKYLVTIRVIQPFRIQDVVKMYPEIWNVTMSPELEAILHSLHGKMKDEDHIKPVRRGTYTLTSKGMEVCADAVKERDIDNARMFLMKGLRKAYDRNARRLR